MAEGPADPPDPDRGHVGFLTFGRTQAFTLVVGIAIMALTLLFNNWIIKAKSVFENLERVNAAFENLDQASLVLLFDLCDRSEESISPMDLARVVAIGNTIQRHDALLSQAHDTAINLINQFEWPRIEWSSFSDSETADYESKGQIDWGKIPVTEDGKIVPAPITGVGGVDPAKARNVAMPKGETDAASPQRPKSEREIICDRLQSDPNDLVVNFRMWRASLKGFSNELEIPRSDQIFTGRESGVNEIMAQQLRAKMAIITHWWLPVLNGALGAIIFCLTRMLRDRSRAPKLGEVILRMVFGGFAGIVVSTLLLPSGVMLGSFSSGAPAVSLLAFIFGFSLDSFIQVLERLNKMVVDSTSPKDAGSG